MKTFDCFTFFNELDLLELRLNYLDDAVDHFVLVEADRTHSGKPKPYYYEENRERFKQFWHKIIHIKIIFYVDDLNFTPATDYNPNDAYWELENTQRNWIVDGLTNAKDDDVVIISDLDEIPNKALIPLYKKETQENLKQSKPKVSIQRFSYYYFNYVFKHRWHGSIFTTKWFLDKTTPQDLRNRRNLLHTIKGVKLGGWHFSYLGDVNYIITKLKSYAHSEHSNGEYVNPDYIKQKITNGESIFDTQKLQKIDIYKEEFPDYLIKNIEKYEKYLLIDDNLNNIKKERDLFYEDDTRFKLKCGKKIGTGSTRIVYEHIDNNDLVIKKNKGDRHNMCEFLCWELAKKMKLDHWLAPCVDISKSGNYLIQKRGQPIMDKDIPQNIPEWLKIEDRNKKQWVKINNNIVKCDYGSSEYKNLKQL